MAKRKAKATKVNTRNVATKDVLLRSAGPKVVELPSLPISGLTFLMKRVDLLVLAREGEWPQPVCARVARLMSEGLDEQVKRAPDDLGNIEELRAAAAAVAKACIVDPPQAYVDGEIGLDEIEVDKLEPLFSDDSEVTTDALHPTDLNYIMTLAFAFGPGALRFFRD